MMKWISNYLSELLGNMCDLNIIENFRLFVASNQVPSPYMSSLSAFLDSSSSYENESLCKDVQSRVRQFLT